MHDWVILPKAIILVVWSVFGYKIAIFVAYLLFVVNIINLTLYGLVHFIHLYHSHDK